MREDLKVPVTVYAVGIFIFIVELVELILLRIHYDGSELLNLGISQADWLFLVITSFVFLIFFAVIFFVGYKTGFKFWYFLTILIISILSIFFTVGLYSFIIIIIASSIGISKTKSDKS